MNSLEPGLRTSKLRIPAVCPILRRNRHSNIRLQADLVNLVAVRGEPSRHCDMKRRTIREFMYLLNRTLSKGLLPYKDGAIIVPQGSGHDFGSAGRSSIHKESNLPALRWAAYALRGVVAFLSGSLQFAKNITLPEEQTGGFYRSVQQPAAVAAQVQHDLVDTLGLQLLYPGLQLLCSALGKNAHPSIADAAILVQ